MRIAVPKKHVLPRRLQELAPGARATQRVVAAHVPRQDPELRQAARVDARGVDGHVDGLPVVPIGVAGVGVVEEEFAGRVVGEERREDVSVIAVHVAEVIEAERGVVPSAEPPCVADVLLVVPFAVREVVRGVRFGAVEGEGLGVAIEADDTVDVVAGQSLGYNVGVEGVEEVVCLVWKRWRRGREIPLAGEREEHRHVLHDIDERLVQVVLYRLDDTAHLGR